MNIRTLFAAATVFAATGMLGISSVQAMPFSFEARTLGMGNARVATASIAAAPFANPAMLAHRPLREDFALLVSLGAFVNDNQGVADLVDEFQGVFDQYQATNDPGIAADAISIANQLHGKVIAPEATGMFSVGMAGEVWSFALSARADLIAAGTVTDIAQTESELNDPNKNILSLEGVMAGEIGVSFARNFQVMDRKVSIGLKPKIVNLQSVFYQESITTIDVSIDDIRNDVNDLGNYTTLDAGITVSLTDHILVGLVANNLIAHEVNFVSQSGAPLKLNFDTQLRLGAAYHTDLFTLGADIDLIENEAFLANNSFKALKSQNLSVGAEFNIWDFMQLRAGIQKNFADGIPEAAKDNMITGGVGFWFGFSLDLAVVKQNDSLGGMLQAGFRF